MCIYFILAVFTFIKNCRFSLCITHIELRECNSSVSGIWIWDLQFPHNPGTVSKTDFHRVQIISCHVLMWIMLQKESHWLGQIDTNQLSKLLIQHSWLLNVGFRPPSANLCEWKRPASNLWWSLLPAAWHLVFGATTMQTAAARFSLHHLLEVAFSALIVLGSCDPQRLYKYCTIQSSFSWRKPPMYAKAPVWKMSPW